MAHLFDLNDEHYRYYREINPLLSYIEQMGYFLHVKTGDALEDTKAFVKSILLGKVASGFNNPEITYYSRDIKTGDKEEETSTLYDFIMSSISEELIRVPSFTCYFNPDNKKSLLVDFLDDGIKTRNVYKRKALDAEARGDDEGYKKYNPTQLVAKKRNNGISGLLTSRSTPLYNYSAHYTLTSMTRGVSSVGNGMAEKMVAGNLNYQHPNVVYSDIITNLYTSKYKDELIKVIRDNNLYIPTPEDVLSDILESTRLYWDDREEESKILSLLKSLSDMDRAVFTYSGNLFRFNKYNKKLMDSIITEFIKVIPINDDDHDILDNVHPAVTNLLHHVCMDKLKGKGTRYNQMDNETLDYLSGTARNLVSSLSKYKDILSSICRPHVIPPNLAYIKTMIRKVTLLSDTDSTCGSYQEWVRSYFGEHRFDSKSVAVSATIMTFTTESMGHLLKIYSGSMGVPGSNMDLLDMKNEFSWLTMTPATVSKHYYADVIVREGAVYSDSKLELKGPHLIASTTARIVADGAKKMMTDINRTISEGKKIKIFSLINEVVRIENIVIGEIKKGNPEYFNIGKINNLDAYKNPLPANPFIRHMFWNDTFGKYYTLSPEPPYATISISTTLDTKRKTEDWLIGLSNKELATDINKFLITYNKSNIPTIHMNPTIMSGIPNEIIEIMSYKSLTIKIMNPLYMVLETLGFYRKPTILVSELINGRSIK